MSSEASAFSKPKMETRGTALALPETTAALLEHRKKPARFSLNDKVEDIHLRLYDRPEYRRLLAAVYNEQSVEGNVLIDDIEAARMIRSYAEENGIAVVASEKLGVLVKALGVVLRRYGVSRKERRDN